MSNNSETPWDFAWFWDWNTSVLAATRTTKDTTDGAHRRSGVNYDKSKSLSPDHYQTSELTRHKVKTFLRTSTYCHWNVTTLLSLSFSQKVYMTLENSSAVGAMADIAAHSCQSVTEPKQKKQKQTKNRYEKKLQNAWCLMYRSLKLNNNTVAIDLFCAYVDLHLWYRSPRLSPFLFIRRIITLLWSVRQLL